MEFPDLAGTPCKSMKLSAPSSSGTKASGEASFNSKTPPLVNSNRIRNRGVTLSISEVRKAAECLRQSNEDDPVMETKSARKQILSWESPVKKPKGSDKLPEKYETLNRFFSSLDASIKLLRMRAAVPIFTVLSKQIECMSDRRFTYQHLAQLKYILPEVIEIKRDLVYDEQTSCMKPDLRITLNTRSVENDGNPGPQTSPVDLRKLFHTRLLDFIEAHPMGEEIPEESLPSPFNLTGHNKYSKETPSAISSSPSPQASRGDPSEFQAVKPSHFSQTFRRHFSQKIRKEVPAMPIPDKILEKNDPLDAKVGIYDTTLSSYSATAAKEINSLKEVSPERTSHVESTPVKCVSTPVSLMSSTPAIQPPPKRCCFSPEDGPANSLPSKLLRRLPRNRSLKFDSPLKSNMLEDQMSLADDSPCTDDVLDVITDDLVQSITEKERKAMEERDPAISQAKRRLEIIAELPKVFNAIYFIFQSSKRNVITRDELIYQITTSHLNVVDRKEVEEELDILKELVPEWISEQVASSGDTLFRINKGVSASDVRSLLADAK
ncbi:hypothetical protein SAY87_023403 [Trapa incisa]|uniref:CDT1 Geminin-binding domain-containing protein n=1 Tax=Trapa incisa TaxID=236973 RepID=A0AAN7QR32_9MYRT|nr:hypothetical protein SAY87_023403 [Trapa incisa]